MRLADEAGLVGIARGRAFVRLGVAGPPARARAAPLDARELLTEPPVLVAPPLVLTNPHAIHPRRAADEGAFTGVPRELAAEAVEHGAVGADDLDALALVEHVVAELAPARLTPFEHLGHQRVEVGRSGALRRHGAGSVRGQRGHLGRKGGAGQQEAEHRASRTKREPEGHERQYGREP